MASIYQLKPAFQNLLRPFVRLLAKSKVSANQVTVFTCLASRGVSYWLFLDPLDKNRLFIVPVFMLFRMAMNAVDGMLAREFNMKSPLGAILNEVTDVISDAVLYYPIGIILGANINWVVLFLLIAFLTEMVGVVALQVSATRRYDGPFGKSDRAFVFSILALLAACKVRLYPYMNSIFLVLVILSALTVIQRSRAALNEGKK